jgi:hypothetical protein
LSSLYRHWAVNSLLRSRTTLLLRFLEKEENVRPIGYMDTSSQTSEFALKLVFDLRNNLPFFLKKKRSIRPIDKHIGVISKVSKSLRADPGGLGVETKNCFDSVRKM